MTETKWNVTAIKAAMKADGSHWWDRDTLKFFGTKVASAVYQGPGGVFFVTSEWDGFAGKDNGTRAYTLRQYVPERVGVETIGNIGDYKSDLAAAVAKAKELAGSAAGDIGHFAEQEREEAREQTTHAERIQYSLSRAAHKITGGNHWGARHCGAWANPKPQELPIVRMIEAAAVYADNHKARFESPLGEDSFLGPEWGKIVKAIRALLNGECGRLDCGTVDSLLLDMLNAEGMGDE